MSGTWEYVVNSGAWSVGGLVLGYLLGRLERDIGDIKRGIERNGETDDDA